MRVGSLCTGYGGLEMGLRLADVDVDLRWTAEYEPALKPLDDPWAPNLGDLTLIDWTDVERVDLVTAGFPCQPFSAAGAQLAEADPRYLWPQVLRCLVEVRPRMVLLENVRNLPSMRKGEVWRNILDDLGRAGYAVRWLTLGACAVGAAHHRHRVFALGTQQGHETDEVEHLDVQQCGARRGVAVPTPTVGDSRNSRNATAGRSVNGSGHSGTTLSDFAQLLPTPTSRDGDGRGTGDAEYWDRRQATGRTNGFPLDATVALLPTPRSRDHKGAETEASRQARVDRGAAHEGHDLSTALALLPTPRASDHEFGGRQLTPDGRTPGGYGADLIDLAASRLLPTPRASDGVNGGPGQRGSAGDLAMPSAVQPEHWGRFAAAVARHESLYGPAPVPTEPNRNGAPRLSAAFAEWLMCIPAGHVTGVLDRRAALKAIGNGVCPPQLAAAWNLLTAGEPVIDTSLGKRVRSRAMTTTTNDQIREIQDRDAEGRGRVIAATMALGVTVDPALIEAAMMELAAFWREQAAWWLASGKRGGKGTAAELTQAAGRLAGFAVGLSTRPVQMPAVDLPEPGRDGIETAALEVEAKGNSVEAALHLEVPSCSHPVEALSTSKHTSAVTCTACGAKVGALQRHEGLVDPTGVSPETNQYTEAFQNAVAAELTKLERESADVQPAPSAPSIIDNPFTSPNAPGAGARPAVAALPYAVLPVIASQLAPRTQLSHSFVETFEGCSLRSMLERASRHNLIGPQRPGWSLVGGNAFHAAVEEIERDVVAHPGRVPVSSRGIHPASDEAVIVDVDAVFVAALDAAVKTAADELPGSAYADPGTWYASNSGKEGYDWWRVEGALMLHRYLEHHGADFRSKHTVLRLQPLNSVAAVPVIEQEFVTSIAPDAGSGTSALTTKGFIDIVWLKPPQTLIIADWKTGSRRPTSTFQLGEYAHALTTLLPAGLADADIVGSYWLARKGEYTPQVPLLAKHPADEMTYRYRQAALGSSLGLAAPHVTDMCTACGVKDYCPAQATR